VILLVLAWGFPLLFVWLMWQRPSNRTVAAFAKTYEVPLTIQNVDQLRRYIQWTRRWRLAGVVVAMLLAGALSMFTRRGGFSWVPLVAGYSIGSLLGELLRPVERPVGSPPIATLERRRVRDFMVPQFVTAAFVVFVVGLLPAFFLLYDSPHRRWTERLDPIDLAQYRPQDWFVIGLSATSVAAGAVAWIGARMLAQSPMPADTPDRLAARHAIRSAAILALVGGTVMVSGTVGAKLGTAATLLDGDASQIIRWTNNIATILCGLSALWGGLLTLTTIPRVAPFAGRLPTVPRASSEHIT
jgi:hypothetical protein